MAKLRPVEERDARGATTRTNPAITFTQDRQIRKVVGRNDFQMLDNPDYHEPITVQVQDGKIVFFRGAPNSTQSRAQAKEMKQEDVPAYIIKGLREHPVKMREQKPAVYEVRIATVGDVETAVVSELVTDGESVTVTPTEPDINPVRRSRTRQPSLDEMVDEVQV